MRLLAVCVVLSAAVAFAAAPPAPVPAAWLALIDQLGDDDDAVRKASEKKLVALGESAIPALRRAAKTHDDPDVRLRAVLLLPAIEAQAYREVRRLADCNDNSYLLAVSPDGKRVLGSTHQSWVARVWDVASGKLVLSLKDKVGHPHDVRGIAWSPDGKRILTADESGRLRLWDAETAALLKTHNVSAKALEAVAFTADGKKAICCCGTTDDKLRVVDLATGKQLAGNRDGTGGAHALALLPGGKQVAVTGKGGDVWLHDVETCKRVRQMEIGMPSFGLSVAASPEGHLLAACGGDWPHRVVVRVWDVRTGKRVKDLSGPGPTINCVAFSADGKRLVSAGHDEQAIVWDVESGKAIQNLRHKHDKPVIANAVVAAAFLPDGDHAFTSGLDGTVRLWRVRK